jgi:predicted Zn finger-like uncharacterized protein
MSLITRCPACQTLFKVVPDQLRISEGWVRCGQCGEAFDASLRLLPAVPAAASGTSEMVPPVAVASPQALEAQDADSDETPFWRTSDPPDEVVPVLAADWDVSVHIDLNDLEDSSRQRTNETQEPSFLRAPPTSAAWRKPLVRILLLVLGITLLLGLVGQIAVHERDRIVNLEPRLRGLFMTLCGPLNCVLAPLQQKNAVVIDGASFTKIKPDAYRLNFTLRNTAATVLALPAIELTLTDSLDQPVVRRVFLASELGKTSNTLTPTSEWTASLAIAVKTASTAERIVGYRLLAFYP